MAMAAIAAIAIAAHGGGGGAKGEAKSEGTESKAMVMATTMATEAMATSRRGQTVGLKVEATTSRGDGGEQRERRRQPRWQGERLG